MAVDDIWIVVIIFSSRDCSAVIISRLDGIARLPLRRLAFFQPHRSLQLRHCRQLLGDIVGLHGRLQVRGQQVRQCVFKQVGNVRCPFHAAIDAMQRRRHSVVWFHLERKEERKEERDYKTITRVGMVCFEKLEKNLLYF